MGLLDRVAARGLHYFFYALLVLMPLSGWMMSSAFGRPVGVFGLFTLPDLIGADKTLGKTLREFHELTADVLMAAIAAHFAAALKHHFVDKDVTLRRMLPFAFLLFLSVFVAGSAFAQSAMKWRLLASDSTVISTDEKGVSSPASSFSTDIYFDPTDLGGSRISFSAEMMMALVPAGSISGEDKEYFSKLSKKAGGGRVSPDSPGLLSFTSSSIQRKDGNNFVMTGEMSVGERKKSMDIPFSTVISKNGDGTINITLSGGFMIMAREFASDKFASPATNQMNISFQFEETPVL
jgi:cytochrome b561